MEDGPVEDDRPEVHVEPERWSRLRAGLYALVSRNPASNRMAVELAGVGPGDRVLDIGCGPGAAVRAAAGVAAGGVAAGVDPSPSMVKIAERRSRDFDNVFFYVGSAEALPLAEASFDVAWTVHAFHHWTDVEAGLAEVRRVLVPWGRFFVVERWGNHNHGMNDAEAARTVARLEEAGFGETAVSRRRKEVVVTATARPLRPGGPGVG